MDYSGDFIALDRAGLVALVEEFLSEKRAQHVFRVEETAIELAEKYGESAEKASIAALAHDLCKEMPDDKAMDVIIRENLDLELLEYGNNIWHGPVAAVYLENELSVTDEDILNAVRNHTVGAPKMSLLEQIIFVADYIEPGRNFPGVDEARQLAADNLTKVIDFATYHTLMHLLEKKVKIYPGTIDTYNAWSVEKGS